MKIVIPLSDEFNLMEQVLLKYTLRSIEAEGIGNNEKVVILGKRREWFSDKIEVCNITGNISTKIVEWCKIGEPFTLMEYNMFLSEPFNFRDIRYYVNGNISDQVVDPSFSKSMPFPVMRPKEIQKLMTSKYYGVRNIDFRQQYGICIALQKSGNNTGQGRLIEYEKIKTNVYFEKSKYEK